MEEFLFLKIPVFHVRYKKWKEYGYVRAEEKENLKEALTEASGGYCMYCYSRIQVDHKFYGNLEHAIEKSNSEKLVECIPDIGLACTVCNQSFKRAGERKRKIPEQIITKFEEESKCSVLKRKQCTVPCGALKELCQLYSKLPNAEIILQPMGVRGRQTKEFLTIRYNVLKMQFEPDTDGNTYSKEEIIFINRHIRRFRLNDPQFRTYQLADFIKNMVDHQGMMQKYEYNNMLVQLFADKLEGKSAKEKAEICGKIYTLMFLNL